jgi:hypothetical protein
MLLNKIVELSQKVQAHKITISRLENELQKTKKTNKKSFNKIDTVLS